MEDTSSVSSQQEGSQGGGPISLNELELNPEAPADSLEVKIAHRAHEISQVGGEDRGPNLASWLKAAREILSEEPERPQWSA